MFDIAWQELLIIAIVALIFIGPKDLPRAIRTVTTWIRTAQRMAREFQANVDEFVRESELHEMREQARKMAQQSLASTAEDIVDPSGELRKTFSEPPVPSEPFNPAPSTEPTPTETPVISGDGAAAPVEPSSPAEPVAEEPVVEEPAPAPTSTPAPAPAKPAV